MTAFSQDGDSRWDDVRVFLAAHRVGTLGGAARKLGLDTSTMSRRLTAFEDALGARLFDRSRQGLTPTRAAELVLAAAEAMEAAHARLARDASDVEATAQGAALDLTRHEADLALRSVAPKGAELIVTRLGRGRWIAAGAPALVKKLGRLAAWTDAPWIAWDRDMASLPAARWLAAHAPDAAIALRTSVFTTQLIAAASGMGLVLAPEPYRRRQRLAPVRLAPALEADAAGWPTDSLWLVGHRALRDVPRVAAVWSFFAEELRRALA
ncbi:MAG: LysR family transcriptional regulator [Deltaproteobacteria bacterium]|nr:LysR family transcriptional regulator [Deltaproteobacteria bacterium]